MFFDDKSLRVLGKIPYLQGGIGAHPYDVDIRKLPKKVVIRRLKNFPAMRLIKTSEDFGEMAHAFRRQFEEIDSELEKRADKKR